MIPCVPPAKTDNAGRASKRQAANYTPKPRCSYEPQGVCVIRALRITLENHTGAFLFCLLQGKFSLCWQVELYINIYRTHRRSSKPLFITMSDLDELSLGQPLPVQIEAPAQLAIEDGTTLTSFSRLLAPKLVRNLYLLK